MKYLNLFTVCQAAASNLDRWRTKPKNLLWGRCNHSWSTRLGCGSLEDCSSDTSQGRAINDSLTIKKATSVNRASFTVQSSNYYPLSFQIVKAHVDQFKPGHTGIIPSCEVELVWTGGEQVLPQQLRHRVTLTGTKPLTYFHIRHDPQAVGGYELL